MNKEEVLYKHIDLSWDNLVEMRYEQREEKIYAAMEEYARYIQKQEFERQISIREEYSKTYAKQQAIEFNEWVESKRFMKHRGEWYDTKHDGQNWGTFPSYTKEQLYNLFINQKENK